MKKYTLPSMEYSFKIQVTGEESGLTWVGDFKYKRPTLMDRSLINAMKTRLNGDLVNGDPKITSLNEALAHLRFTLPVFPEWWKDSDYGSEMYDMNVIMEVYNKCLAFETEWKKKIHSGNPEDVEAKNISE